MVYDTQRVHTVSYTHLDVYKRQDDKVSEKDSRNCKKASVHYGGCIFPIVYRNHIIPCCQTQNKRCRRAGACFKAVASRSETRQKKVDLAACGVTAIRSFLKRRI